MAKILAADDDAAMRAFYLALLEDGGYEAAIEEDAARAMDKALDFKPDLMILDADMPGGGGERVFVLARKILALGVPVIFVTGLPERVQGFALFEEHVSIFQKPVAADALLGEIERLLKKTADQR